MENDVLFLVYNSEGTAQKSISAKQIIKLGEKEHHMSFDLIWCPISFDDIGKDDFYLSKIRDTATIDDLLLITDEQGN